MMNRVKHNQPVSTQNQTLSPSSSTVRIDSFFALPDDDNYYDGEFNEGRPIPLQSCSYEVTKFYVAELVLALKYLHNIGILHRDLKPESKFFFFFLLFKCF